LYAVNDVDVVVREDLVETAQELRLLLQIAVDEEDELAARVGEAGTKAK